MPSDLAHKKNNCMVLFIIEGPCLPADLDAFYKVIVDELKQWAPGT